jgi:hypothetical protein
MNKRKPRGYWENIDNVIHELEPLIKKYGRFPSSNEMAKEGMSSLSRYIAKYHGGIISVADKIGIKTYDQEAGRKHQNTWTENLVISEFKEYVKVNDLDYYPSRYELNENGSDIYSGITQVFKSYKKFKEVLATKNYVLNKKPKESKWSYDSAIKTLDPIINQLGYFPSVSDLDSINLSGLRGYISKNNLIQKLKKHFKVKGKPRKHTVSRESGFWNDPQNIKTELQTVFDTYGRIPSNKELMELGYGSFHTHIKKLPEKVLQNFNYYASSNLLKTKDGDYVRSIYELLFDNFLSFNNINHSTEALISESEKQNYLYDFKLILNNNISVYVEIWGYTRNSNKLEKAYHKKRQLKEEFYKKLSLNLIGIDAPIFEKPFQKIYNYFEKQVAKYDKSFKAKKMDLDYLLYGSSYNEEDVVKQLKLIVENNDGFFPSTNELRQTENGEGLISQIQKYGGVSHFKGILNTDIAKKKSKWSIEYLKNELYAINQLKYLPSYDELSELKRLDILGGIQKNGGFKKVAHNLGISSRSEFLKRNPKPSKTKWTMDFLIKELQPIIEKHKTVPSEGKLINLGRMDLVVGIKQNGGFVRIKERLNLKSSRKKWTEEKVLKELNFIINETHGFPTSKDFKEMNRGDLLAGINSLGGLNLFRKKLGFGISRQGRKSKTYSIDEVIKQVTEVIDELGYFPSTNDLNKLNKSYLSSRIQTVGGFQKLRRIMGYELRKK